MKIQLLLVLLSTTACGLGKEIRDVKDAVDGKPSTETSEKSTGKKTGGASEKVVSKKPDQGASPSRQKFEITPDGCKAIDVKAFDTDYGFKAFVLAECGASKKIKMADQKRGAKEYNFKNWENVEACFNVKSFDVAQNDSHFAIVSHCVEGANGISSKIVVLDNETNEITKIAEYKEASSFTGVRANVAFNKEDGAYLASIGNKIYSFDNSTVLMDFELGQVPSYQVQRLSPMANGYVATLATGECSFVSQGMSQSKGMILAINQETDSLVVSGQFAVTYQQSGGKITVFKLDAGCTATKVNEYNPKSLLSGVISALAINDDQVMVMAQTRNGGLVAAYLSDEAGNFEEAVGGKAQNAQVVMVEDSLFAAYADGVNAWIVETK